MAATYKEIDDKLDIIISQIAELRRCQDVDRTKNDNISDTVQKHEKFFFPNNGNDGFVATINKKVDSLLTFRDSALKVWWIIVTPLLLAIGSGVVLLLLQNGKTP